MNKKPVLALFLILPIIALPVTQGVLAAPTYVDEGHAVVPYLVTSVKAWYKNPLATASVHSPSVASIDLTIEAGFIPTPERAIALAKVRSFSGDLRILANETSTEDEYKLKADQFMEDSKLDWLRPVEELDIIQANATWVTTNLINSTGKYHMLLISWSKNFTITKVFLDDDANVTTGYKVLYNSSYTGNLFWLAIPYGLWNTIYIVFKGTEIPTVKILKNAIPVADHRMFQEDNIVVKDVPEELEAKDETTNVFVGVKNLHVFILNIIKNYIKEHFGVDEIYGYNVSSVKFKLALGRYLKYEGAMVESLKLDILGDLQGAFSSVQLTIGTTLDQIRDVIKDIDISGTVNTYVAPVTDVVAQADKLGVNLVNMFTDVGANIQEALQQAGLQLNNIVGKTISEAIAEAQKTIADFSGELLEATKIAIGTAVNNTIQFTNKAIGVVTGLVQKAKWLLLGFIIIVVVLISTTILLVSQKKIRFGGGRGNK